MTEEQKQDLDDKALAAIQLCLSNEVLREVIHEKNAADLCQKLELTKNLTITSKLIVKHCMHMLNMAEGTSLKSHLEEFTSIWMYLEIKYEEEDQALMLLLPPFYKHFRDTSKQTLTFEEVKAAFFSKVLMDKELIGSSNPAQGLVVRGRSSDSDKDSGSSSRPKSRSKSKIEIRLVITVKRKGISRLIAFI